MTPARSVLPGSSSYHSSLCKQKTCQKQLTLVFSLPCKMARPVPSDAGGGSSGTPQGRRARSQQSCLRASAGLCIAWGGQIPSFSALDARPPFHPAFHQPAQAFMRLCGGLGEGPTLGLRQPGLKEGLTQVHFPICLLSVV